jgi:hypothetical protein
VSETRTAAPAAPFALHVHYDAASETEVMRFSTAAAALAMRLSLLAGGYAAVDVLQFAGGDRYRFLKQHGKGWR